MNKRLRILHCPADVGGNAWTLSRAERSLGLDSKVMVYQGSWPGYPSDIDLHWGKGSAITNLLKLFAFYLKALVQYDIFHFNFGRSLWPAYHRLGFSELDDLPALRALGKKIVVTFQGCDVRQREFCNLNYPVSACSDEHCAGRYCSEIAGTEKQRQAEMFGRYAHKIFTVNPDLLRVLPPQAQFLPYACVDLKQWYPRLKNKSEKFVVLHAPTNRDIKGTKYILKAVAELEKKYKNLQFTLIENEPHEKVQELYLQADIAIDQLLVGWYGRFAVEMMSLGKPVICYIREEDLQFIPSQMAQELPIVNASQATIQQVLERLINDPGNLALIGEKGRAYVEKWHDPIKIAQKMKETYESLF